MDPSAHSGSLGMLIWPLVMIALGVLAAGIGLWMMRRHAQGNRRVAAQATSDSGRREAPESATAGFQPVLLDPSFGGWPITGDFPLHPTGARPSGQ